MESPFVDATPAVKGPALKRLRPPVRPHPGEESYLEGAYSFAVLSARKGPRKEVGCESAVARAALGPALPLLEPALYVTLSCESCLVLAKLFKWRFVPRSRSEEVLGNL